MHRGRHWFRANICRGCGGRISLVSEVEAHSIFGEGTPDNFKRRVLSR